MDDFTAGVLVGCLIGTFIGMTLVAAALYWVFFGGNS